MATNDVDPALPVAVLKVLSEHTGQRYDAVRAEAGETMAAGDRRNVHSPLDGAKLGAVYKSNPSKTVHITDMAALTAWIQELYPELMENGYEVAGSEAEVVAVLFAHAPRLLRPIRRVKGSALSALRKESVSLGQVIGPGGEADVPGIEIDQPDGVVACRPGPGALEAVKRLFAAGRLTLDGTLRPALEASNDT